MAVFFYRIYFILFTLATTSTTIIPDKSDHGNDSSLSNAKSWMTYLTYTLEDWLFNTMFTVVQCLQEVRYPISHLIKWCEPPQLELDNVHRKSIIHDMIWAPCGYLMFTFDAEEDKVIHWVTVHRRFYIHYIFLNFEVDDSGITCEHSAVHIVKLKNMDSLNQTWQKVATYCGYREPWNITVESSRSILYIKQINAFRPINITVKYVTFDKSLKGFYRPEESDSQLYLTSHQTLSLTQISKFQHRWIIKGNLGFVHRLQLLRMSEVVHRLKIFDGVKTLFPLYVFSNKGSGSSKETVNCTTQYFQSHIVIDNEHSAIHHTLVRLTFRVIKLDAFHLHHYTKTNIKSSDQITHSVFSLKSFNGRFAVLFIKFHKFQGWNWGGCNYGGYAIQQNIDDITLSSTTIGPFCSASSPRHSYTSQHSLPFFVMNDKLAYFIIYGYGSMYTLDIDIKVTSSPCVGIMEPLLMWFPDKGMTKPLSKTVIPTAFATLSIELTSLDSMAFNPRSLNIITFQNIHSCFYMQSLSYPNRKHITYDILFRRGDVKIQSYFLLENMIDQRHGHVTLEVTQNYGRPHRKEFPNYDRINLLDLQRLKIMQYTGEAYNYLCFTALIMPLKPYTCADSTSEYLQQFQGIDGLIYAVTHQSCLLNMFISNVTYVFVLTSKLPNWQVAKPLWYIHFQKVNCEEVSTIWDTITTHLAVASKRQTSHTVDFLNDEVFLQSYHTGLSFVYRRRQQCDRVLMRYRDVGTYLLASYVEMHNHVTARIRVSMTFLSNC